MAGNIQRLPEETSSHSQPFIVLIVENYVVTRSNIAEHLRESGFQVIEAANADEAVNLVKSGVTLNLVFTDYDLPGSMNGLQLVVWLKHYPEVRTFLTSGSYHPSFS